MRNIKIKNAAMLFAAASGLLYMTACSSDITGPDGQKIPDAPAETQGIEIINPDQTRVHVFDNGTRAAANASFEMKACPETGTALPADGKLSNGTYLVSGDVTVTNLSLESGSAEIYIAEQDGRLETDGIPANVTVYNCGILYLRDNATVNGTIYSNKHVRALNLKINGTVKAKGILDAEGSKLDIAGGTVVANVIKAKDLTVENASVYTGYVKANNLTQKAAAIITLDQNGLMMINDTYKVYKDAKVEVADKTDNKENANAAVAVKKNFVADEKGTPKTVFDAVIGLDFNNSLVGNNAVKFNDFEWQVCSDDRVVYVPEVIGCHPEYIGKKLNGVVPEGEVFELKKVAEVEAPENDKTVSATCLAVDGDKVYATYHIKGNQINGWIESINNGNDFTLSQAAKAPYVDFNHIIIDGNNIVAVGSRSKVENGVKKMAGGIITRLPKDFTADSKLSYVWLKTNEVVYTDGKNGNPIVADYLNAGDGNCVARVDNKYIVAASHGYLAVNASDLSRVDDSFHWASPTKTYSDKSSSKHIAVNNTTISVLSHDGEGNARINHYNDKDLTVEGSKKDIQKITPLEGKNVLAYDTYDTKCPLYACLGKTGLAKNGELVKTFGNQIDADGGLPVNAVAFDANYIYVAVGSFLYVFDKELNEVCHYQSNDAKSANYVVVNGGKIYVAYGKDGVQVFELNTKTFPTK